jgi:hypothetical protein
LDMGKYTDSRSTVRIPTETPAPNPDLCIAKKGVKYGHRKES